MIKITDQAQLIFKKEIEKEENKGFKLRLAAMKKDNKDFQ